MGSFPKRSSNSNLVKASSFTPVSRIARGALAEQLACEYLQRQGFALIEKNFRVKAGEIDLIMRDSATLVFVEVRYRQNEFFCSALESITWRKQQRIIRAAHIFNMRNNLSKILPSRFDVVTLTGNLRNPKIAWIADAFSLDG